MSDNKVVNWTAIEREGDPKNRPFQSPWDFDGETCLFEAERSGGDWRFWKKSIWEIAWVEVPGTDALRARAFAELKGRDNAEVAVASRKLTRAPVADCSLGWRGHWVRPERHWPGERGSCRRMTNAGRVWRRLRAGRRLARDTLPAPVGSRNPVEPQGEESDTDTEADERDPFHGS